MSPKHSNRKKLLPREIIAVFGAHNISNAHELNRKPLSPSQILIHEDWKTETSKYDANIAVLVFDEEIHFTRFIKPVCIWKSTAAPLVKKGIFVGWGKGDEESRNFIASTPRQLKIPIHENQQCFFKDYELAVISSPRTFCAGDANGTGVNIGDSGSGLFTKIDDAFYITGIASSCKTNYEGCDLNTYSVFTNVLKFQDWILNILNPKPEKPSQKAVQKK